MLLLVAAMTVSIMVLTGLAMFRSMAVRLLGHHWREVSETDLLLIGVLPGLALVGGLATYLSLLHLLRPWLVATGDLVLLYLLRRHVYAILAGIAGNIRGAWVGARHGNFFAAIAIGGGCALFAVGLALCRIPSGNVDVWVFHIPLAQSLVAHHGIVSPQLDGMPFYGNQPLFFEQLYALVMLASPNFSAAGAVNIVILFGFLLLLLSFARRARAIQFLIIVYIFFFWQSFPLSAAEPMTDLTRSCFSAAAYLFAYRYASRFWCFDLVMAALMAGAAVAGKYTELVTPGFIVVTLALLILFANNKAHIWRHFIPAAIVFSSVASVWYLKNLFLLGNPVYPFLFGHPGLSDQWMSGYMQEMTRSFDVAERVYSTNLTTLRGWHDFLAVLGIHFFTLTFVAMVGVFGLLLPMARRWLLPAWTLLLFVFWYAVMFNGERWAVTAILLLLTTSMIVWMSVADRIAAAWNPHWPTALLEAGVSRLRRLSDPWTAAASLGLAVALLFGVVRFKDGHGQSFLPSWMSREMAIAVLKPRDLDRYLVETKPGYAMYRYVGQHDLSLVLQPFDNGAVSYVSAYNGGHPNDWILPFGDLPDDAADANTFATRNGVRYFIEEPALDVTAMESLGGVARVALARAVIARLKSHSRPVFQDGHGMSLFQILPENSRP